MEDGKEAFEHGRAYKKEDPDFVLPNGGWVEEKRGALGRI